MPLEESTLNIRLKDIPEEFRGVFLSSCLVRIGRKDADPETWKDKAFKHYSNGRVYRVTVTSWEVTKAELREYGKDEKA